MSINRRRFLGFSAATLAAGALPLRAWGEPAPQRLAMPPLLDTRTGGRLSLAAQTGQSNFLGTASTLTAGYNQGYLGPTIVTQNGPLAAEVDNRLQEVVTVHWHGMLVPGEHDGSGHSPIEPGGSWKVPMELAQQPATAWYHSHAHGATARHVYFGLAGVIHHTDGRDDQRGLPSRYGVDDLTVVIQDRRFDEAGRMIYNPDGTDILNGFQGERILINGQWNAVAAVPKGIVRLRLLNASNARVYTLHFNDGRHLHLVGTDGGFLPKPEALTYLRMAPGQRAEVLVDFAAGTAPVLMSAAGLAMKILEFAIDDRMDARIVRLPTALDSLPADLPTTEIPTRRFSLNMGGSSNGQGQMAHGGHEMHGAHVVLIGADANGQLAGTTMNDFGINGRPFDMNRISFNVAQGTAERWVVNGGGAAVEHPFHIHGVHFRVVSSGGGDPRPEDAGWRDTILVTGETEVITRFAHSAGRDTPYMYHCHILEHEDAGMMGQFTVG
jgi:blue copper oxidase